MTQEAADNGSEKFALYGFELSLPKTWRVEFNPRGRREKGDVVFHTPKRNRIFISWGPLADANKRFKSLEEQRDWGVSDLKKAQNVRDLTIEQSRETEICGHRALLTQLSASVGGGFLARKVAKRGTISLYFYCPVGARYYVAYSLLNVPDEYADFPGIFTSVTGSMVCH